MAISKGMKLWLIRELPIAVALAGIGIALLCWWQYYSVKLNSP